MERPTTTAKQSFIVRVLVDDRGDLSGVVERVRTGEKRRFDTSEALVAVITSLSRPEPVTTP